MKRYINAYKHIICGGFQTHLILAQWWKKFLEVELHVYSSLSCETKQKEIATRLNGLSLLLNTNSVFELYYVVAAEGSS